ncbi:hypothetical protein HOLleu_16475 [Holothuria leucospilota]|uniref:Uncharacterized protein n=1 Tax=Holothuria leucospilota TaxID=206669 RepID=A0A9Q1C666_HOLLE|nr:hypothetical protein HOLleu_16475 [Holothuria leucospilota]
MRGFDRIHTDALFKLNLSHQNSHMITRRYYFSQHVIDDWNSLPPEAVLKGQDHFTVQKDHGISIQEA